MEVKQAHIVRRAICALVCALAAMGTVAQTAPTSNVPTPVPPGTAAPDKVETRLGTLKFFDGFPDDATIEKLYDNRDFQHAVQAYLLAIPLVNQAAMRKRSDEGVTGTAPVGRAT